MPVQNDVAILITLKDQASQGLQNVGKEMNTLGKSSDSLGDALSTVSKVGFLAVATAAGVAATAIVGMVRAAANQQLETVRSNALLKNAAEAMKFNSVLIKGNSDALKENQKSLSNQRAELEIQLAKVQLSGNAHKSATDAIHKSSLELKIHQAELSKTTVIQDHYVQVVNKNAKSFDDLLKISHQVSQSMIKLGFDDETTALSFAKLLSITHDVDAAQKALTATADFARATNMDFASATTQVGLALQGAGRLLKQWNIDIPDNATQTQALDIILKTFGGTAKEAAGTLAVQLDIMKVAFRNLLEQGGTPFLKFTTDAVVRLNDFLINLEKTSVLKTDVIKALDEIGKAFNNFSLTMQGFAEQLGGKKGIQTDIKNTVNSFMEWWNMITKTIQPAIDDVTARLRELSKILNLNKDDMNLLIAVGKALGFLITSFIIGAVYLLAGALNVLIQVLKFIISIFHQVAAAIKLTQDAIVSLVSKVYSYIDAVNRIPKSISTTITQITKKISGKATGGLVNANETYLVGEKGMELFTPSVSGNITPNDQLSSAPSGVSRSPVNFNIYMGVYAGTETEKRNVAEELYKSLVQLAGMQNKTVASLLGA